MGGLVVSCGETMLNKGCVWNVVNKCMQVKAEVFRFLAKLNIGAKPRF